MSGANPLLQQALSCHQRGDLARAEPLYRRLLQAEPRNPYGLHLLGVLLLQTGRHEDALRLSRRATALAPDEPELWRHQAEMLVRLGRHADALACLDRLVALAPDEADAWTNRGTTLASLGRHAEARDSFAHALTLAPDAPVALGNFGLAQLELGDPTAALATFDRLVVLQPNQPEAHNDRGLALQALDRHEDAIAGFDRALALAPGFPDALNHRGVSQQALGQVAAALASYDAALALRPDDPWFHWNAGLCRMLSGDYAKGWPDYEWRLRTGTIGGARFDRPMWHGEPLAGRTLLLHTEQGLGDIIQFARYAPLIEGASKLILQAPSVLVDLLRTLPGSVEILAAGVRPPRFDLHCPLLSLPARFNSTLADLPRAVPYLSAPAAAVTRWCDRLGVAGLKIGICWQGNPAVRIDRERSVPLACFAPIAACPGVRLISLQKGHGLGQLADLPGIETVGPDGPDTFGDTAALMQCVDLVITSDTAVAHLAGALGRPVWLATSFVPDWRWGLSGEDCPWYPTMRLFRQPQRGDWPSVFKRMAAALPSVMATGEVPATRPGQRS
jgi:Flp pilus assembly protein TadD